MEVPGKRQAARERSRHALCKHCEPAPNAAMGTSFFSDWCFI